MTTQAPNIPYQATPATILNEAIDMLGQSGQIIGDVTDGTPIAEVARRSYGQGLRQLLRTARWNFARKQAKLQLLGDASGAVVTAPVINIVECPWLYAYAWPIDGVYGRWLPWNPVTSVPANAQGIPLTTGTSSAIGYPLVPGRYLVTSSDQYPLVVGTESWTQLPDITRTEGVGYNTRQIILTNCCNAEFVYTRLVTTIEEWDSLFRQALVMMMALAILPTAIKDPKVAIAVRERMVPALKNAIADARVANGNEAGMPQTTDFEASFIRGRNWGAFGANGFGLGAGGVLYGGGLGGYGGGWDQLSWAGSVY